MNFFLDLQIDEYESTPNFGKVKSIVIQNFRLNRTNNRYTIRALSRVGAGEDSFTKTFTNNTGPPLCLYHTRLAYPLSSCILGYQLFRTCCQCCQVLQPLLNSLKQGPNKTIICSEKLVAVKVAVSSNKQKDLE